ncbi:ATP-binding protein [Yersinia hibernica]|uniref:histidine kinase n=1 Tax=Yersinia hibernica TaxID=2339259 RepID=A0ABX5R4H8_9GAMM|nr:ATP-binding protein [Yersinia hibernica]QAX80392.1 response regulator [Yersinia hibernica]
MKFLYKTYLILAFILLSSTANYAAATIVFSPEEQRYIEAHPVVQYGIFPHFYPIEAFNSTGEHIGLTRDYIDFIAAATGIKFQPVSSNSGSESFRNLETGKVSLLTSTSSAFAQSKGLVNTVPIFSTWPVTITRKATRHIATSEDIAEGYVSITDYLSLIEWFTKRYQGVNYKVSNSPEETVGEVIRGRAEAAVVLAPTAFYYMNVIYPGQLKMSRPHNAKIFLVMSARPEDQLLIDIINKVIASISPQQQAELMEKWIIRNNNQEPSQAWSNMYGYGLAAVLLCFLLLVVYRNRRLKMDLIRLGSKNNLELSVLAHELRTPLIGILTACEGLVRKISSPSQRDRLANVIHVTRELLDNLDLSLDYAKINAGSVQQNPQPHLLAELCDTTVKLFISFAETHATTLQVRYLSKQYFLPHLIDGALLSQALNNIVNNAIKHTHSGMVLIECSLLQVDGKKMFCIEVLDTGTGIPHKVLARLSEPFYQGKLSGAARDSNPRPKGTGLGLFVAKKNMHLTGGHLTIASQPGVGSRVRLTFPSVPAHYAIENSLPEGLHIILSADIPPAFSGEISQILEGCEIPYYSSAEPLPTSARGPAIYLQLDEQQSHWQLRNQQGESARVPHPLYASAFYLALSNLCNEDQALELISDNAGLHTADIITQSHRLLVVEDEPLLLEVQQELFSSMGFQVDAVADTQQAYQSWLQHHHRIIVTDCRLDESDGFELVRHLRRLMQDTPEPILIIGQSASLKAEDAQRAREVGMDYLLQKPIAREQWQQLIHDYFASKEKDHD